VKISAYRLTQRRHLRRRKWRHRAITRHRASAKYKTLNIIVYRRRRGRVAAYNQKQSHNLRKIKQRRNIRRRISENIVVWRIAGGGRAVVKISLRTRKKRGIGKNQNKPRSPRIIWRRQAWHRQHSNITYHLSWLSNRRNISDVPWHLAVRQRK